MRLSTTHSLRGGSGFPVNLNPSNPSFEATVLVVSDSPTDTPIVLIGGEWVSGSRPFSLAFVFIFSFSFLQISETRRFHSLISFGSSLRCKGSVQFSGFSIHSSACLFTHSSETGRPELVLCEA